MTAKELRIGNLVLFNGETITVQTINQDFNDEPYYLELYDSDDMFCQADIDECTPIPLTPEWLERMGFEKNGDELMLYQNENTFIIEEKHGGYVYTGGEGVEFSKVFHYVHQLQNLFYALKFEELELDKK